MLGCAASNILTASSVPGVHAHTVIVAGFLSSAAMSTFLAAVPPPPLVLLPPPPLSSLLPHAATMAAMPRHNATSRARQRTLSCRSGLRKRSPLLVVLLRGPLQEHPDVPWSQMERLAGSEVGTREHICHRDGQSQPRLLPRPVRHEPHAFPLRTASARDRNRFWSVRPDVRIRTQPARERDRELA